MEISKASRQTAERLCVPLIATIAAALESGELSEAEANRFVRKQAVEWPIAGMLTPEELHWLVSEGAFPYPPIPVETSRAATDTICQELAGS